MRGLRRTDLSRRTSRFMPAGASRPRGGPRAEACNFRATEPAHEGGSEGHRDRRKARIGGALEPSHALPCRRFIALRSQRSQVRILPRVLPRTPLPERVCAFLTLCHPVPHPGLVPHWSLIRPATAARAHLTASSSGTFGAKAAESKRGRSGATAGSCPRAPARRPRRSGCGPHGSAETQTCHGRCTAPDRGPGGLDRVRPGPAAPVVHGQEPGRRVRVGVAVRAAHGRGHQVVGLGPAQLPPAGQVLLERAVP